MPCRPCDLSPREPLLYKLVMEILRTAHPCTPFKFFVGNLSFAENARFEVQVLYLRRKISLIVIVAFALGNLAIFALYPVYKAVLLVNAAAPKAG